MKPKPKLYFCRTFDHLIYAAAISATGLNVGSAYFTGGFWQIVVSFVLSVGLVFAVDNQYEPSIY